MKTFFAWLRLRMGVIAAALVLFALALIIFMLYSLPIEPVLYISALAAVALIIILALNYLKFARRHRELELLKKEILFTGENLPEVKSLIERDYEDIILLLRREIERLNSRNSAENTEMRDYYTLWVHQIKTPISAMRLLLQTEKTEERSRLEGELFKIEQYVEMVLQYIRLGSDTTDFVIKPCELDGLITSALKKYAGLFILKKISLDYTPVEKSVITDEKWFVFVLEQLISNAVKYTKKGKISIYLEENTLVVEDEGIGIAAEDLPRVFEKGFTGINGRGDEKSSGIGLFLSKKIMKRLAHSLELESEVGKGTRAKIGLDRAEITFE